MEHNYWETGPTQMNVDSMHSAIEYAHDDENWKNSGKREDGQKYSISSRFMENKYQFQRSKKADLVSLCTARQIPPEYHLWFESLPAIDQVEQCLDDEKYSDCQR
uniref:Uncharacterized protein n=1 Tax=Romanomermis culicivorax TaxID=13658 RepID=A0A915IRJ5_ROMCU